MHFLFTEQNDAQLASFGPPINDFQPADLFYRLLGHRIALHAMLYTADYMKHHFCFSLHLTDAIIEQIGWIAFSFDIISERMSIYFAELSFNIYSASCYQHSDCCFNVSQTS